MDLGEGDCGRRAQPSSSAAGEEPIRAGAYGSGTGSVNGYCNRRAVRRSRDVRDGSRYFINSSAVRWRRSAPRGILELIEYRANHEWNAGTRWTGTVAEGVMGTGATETPWGGPGVRITPSSPSLRTREKISPRSRCAHRLSGAALSEEDEAAFLVHHAGNTIAGVFCGTGCS
jgi:hypothetical protein